MNEKQLEDKCTLYARGKGIIAIKLEKTGMVGVPDRLFIASSCDNEVKCIFVEFKNPNGKGKLSEYQKFWKYMLKESFFVVDNFEKFKEIIDNTMNIE